MIQLDVCGLRRERLFQNVAYRGRGRSRAQQRRQHRHDILLCHRAVHDIVFYDWRCMEEEWHDEKELAAATAEVAPGELIQPDSLAVAGALAAAGGARAA